jgi:preprotein translocase subunit SecA
MVEAKEGCTVEPESGVIASVSHPSFFKEYRMVLGITGTAGEPQERDEILQVHGIDSFDVPPLRRYLRNRSQTRMFSSEEAKFTAMAAAVQDVTKTKGRSSRAPSYHQGRQLGVDTGG